MYVLFVNFPIEIVNDFEDKLKGEHTVFAVNDPFVLSWYAKITLPEMIIYNAKETIDPLYKQSFEKIRHLIAFNNTQIYFLGALSKEEDALFCIDHQIDYKPIRLTFDVLVKFISLYLDKKSTINSIHGLQVFPNRLSIKLKNKEIHLLKKEFLLFQLFFHLPNRLISRKEIIDFVWDGITMKSDRTIDVHVAQLRKKIEEFDIRTIRGQGFVWEKNKALSDLEASEI